jgi:hypothetical protein
VFIARNGFKGASLECINEEDEEDENADILDDVDDEEHFLFDIGDSDPEFDPMVFFSIS